MIAALSRLLPFVGRYRRRYCAGLACVLASTTFQLLSPWVLKYAIDDLTANVTRGKLAFYAALLLTVACFGGLFRYLMRHMLIGTSRDVEFDIRNAFLARLQQMPAEYFQARRTGDLMSRATNDLNAVRMMVGPAVLYSTNTLLVLLVAIALMLSIDVRLTLVALLPLPLISVVVRYVGRAIHARFEAILEQLSHLSAIAQEALAGVRVVRAYGREAHQLERFREADAEYVARHRALIRLQSLFYPSMTLCLGLGSLVGLWLGSEAAISGRITLGDFVAFNAYLLMLIWPMVAFGWVPNTLQRGLASWKRMLHVIDAEPEITDAEVTEAGRQAPLTGDVEIRHLTFRYPGAARPALRDVSLRIPAGRTVALVGATGAGKSTLISLLPRLHDPPRGTVLVDGIDVREIPLERLRGAMAMVPQEPFLFSTSIGENVAFGRRALGGTNEGTAGPREPAADHGGLEETSELLSAAAVIAGLDNDVRRLPEAYNTAVGERGMTLSGGQRQRTALARAVMMKPRLLILDDALSAVDAYTEEEILTRLRVFLRRRTAIIVSHRLSTVRAADVIVVLDDGAVVEQGTHDELVRCGGRYAELHRKQSLQEELAAR